MHTSDPTTIPFTKSAYQQMQLQQRRLQVEEKEVIARVQAAREMGDLSENGAYKYGKMELGNIRRQLSKLNYLIKHGTVFEKRGKSQVVSFGCKVTLKSETRVIHYLIVSPHEANPLEGKLSTSSPVGTAVMGKKVGETVVVNTPSGEATYSILSIE